MRKVVVGLIGILLMAASVYGYVRFMKHLDRDRFTMQTIKPARTLQSGEVIELSMLRRVTIAAAAHQPDALVEVEELIGKIVVVPIGREEELSKWKLTVRQSVPLKDQRYYSFKTDSVANVNNMIRKGDRVDVWVELKGSEMLMATGGEKIASLKVIEGLQVSGVKSAEGIEVIDRTNLETALASDAEQFSGARGRPNGVPVLNTYIMLDQVYQAYAAASAIGTIRLALPNLTETQVLTAQVTPAFEQLLSSGRLNNHPNVEQDDNVEELSAPLDKSEAPHELILSESNLQDTKDGSRDDSKDESDDISRDDSPNEVMR
ncbi:MAG: hypothetical protein K6T85_16705 [Gorillibacterium sp.]|nr:hypothetical protein [Gorillibacterium sp.]